MTRSSTMATLDDATRLSFGTLTVLPVPPPTQVNTKVAAAAMLMAPFAALPLAAFSAGVVGLGWVLHLDGLLTGVSVVAILAVMTRGMHLDGLADTVDGIASGRPAPAALEIMRRGDVGPMGVVALILVLLTQVGAVASITATNPARAATVLLVVIPGSRILLPWLCMRGIPAARGDGLGAAVAGSVPRRLGILAAGAELVAVMLFARILGMPVFALLLATGAGVAVGILFSRKCIARLGGITGDVMGASVEVTLTASLVACALAL